MWTELRVNSFHVDYQWDAWKDVRPRTSAGAVDSRLRCPTAWHSDIGVLLAPLPMGVFRRLGSSILAGNASSCAESGLLIRPHRDQIRFDLCRLDRLESHRHQLRYSR